MKTLIPLIGLLLFFSCKKNNNTIVDQQPADKINEQFTVNLTIDGIGRSFIVYLPIGYNNAGKLPMVFALHGGTGNPDGQFYSYCRKGKNYTSLSSWC
jgi:poly(3-hydroxybutyrate) depolymerase